MATTKPRKSAKTAPAVVTSVDATATAAPAAVVASVASVVRFGEQGSKLPARAKLHVYPAPVRDAAGQYDRQAMRASVAAVLGDAVAAGALWYEPSQPIAGRGYVAGFLVARYNSTEEAAKVDKSFTGARNGAGAHDALAAIGIAEPTKVHSLYLA